MQSLAYSSSSVDGYFGDASVSHGVDVCSFAPGECRRPVDDVVRDPLHLVEVAFSKLVSSADTYLPGNGRGAAPYGVAPPGSLFVARCPYRATGGYSVVSSIVTSTVSPGVRVNPFSGQV